jgi:hypothetical protein
MSTPLTDSINALTTYANEITGASDTTLSDAVHTLTNGYGQSGGYTGIEVKTDSNGDITDYIFHGFSEIPNYVLNYASFNRPNGVPVISFADKPISCGKMAFYKVKASIEWSGLSELEKVGNDYALAPNYNAGNNQSAQVVILPKFKGYVDNTYSALNVFRMTSNNTPYAPFTYILPACEIIPQYGWYSLAGNGINITLGSIGHGVKGSKPAPFGGTTNAIGTITIFTTGDKLDSIKTNVMSNNPGSGLNFVFKASEATTYSGTSYAAGDTIVTSTP